MIATMSGKVPIVFCPGDRGSIWHHVGNGWWVSDPLSREWNGTTCHKSESLKLDERAIAQKYYDSHKER